MQAISRAARRRSRPIANRWTRPAFRDQARRWVASVVRGERAGPTRGTERAMNALAARLDRSVRETTDRLIALHGLSGRAAEEILAQGGRAVRDAASARTSPRRASSAAWCRARSAGLAADLAAGGLTFGAGALIGGILGALGAGGAAQAYNLALGAEKGTVGWSAPFLTQRLERRPAALPGRRAFRPRPRRLGRGRVPAALATHRPRCRRRSRVRLEWNLDPSRATGGVGATGGLGGDRARAPPDRHRHGASSVDQALSRGRSPPLPVASPVLTGARKSGGRPDRSRLQWVTVPRSVATSAARWRSPGSGRPGNGARESFASKERRRDERRTHHQAPAHVRFPRR